MLESSHHFVQTEEICSPKLVREARRRNPIIIGKSTRAKNFDVIAITGRQNEVERNFHKRKHIGKFSWLKRLLAGVDE